jgi:hypothetical protein
MQLDRLRGKKRETLLHEAMVDLSRFSQKYAAQLWPELRPIFYAANGILRRYERRRQIEKGVTHERND